MAVVKFENVSRVYKSGDHELKALDSVNMELEEGKFVVILGPSGAGKSTLLNLLGGLDSPTDGKIYVEGEDISKLSNDELADYRAKESPASCSSSIISSRPYGSRECLARQRDSPGFALRDKDARRGRACGSSQEVPL